MQMFLDTAWVPKAFSTLKNVIFSFLSTATQAVDNIEPASNDASNKQVLAICNQNLEHWSVRSKGFNNEELMQAGMKENYDPLDSLNGTHSLIRQELFQVLIYGLLRMRIGLMEACSTSPLPNPLPEVIESEDPLQKRRMDGLLGHACSQPLCKTLQVHQFP